ncbi:hypothetical protein EOS_03810 [Caballeronia mineralivorans PML1(12)]|uniref:Uncharacterized protein n=1 Tax=Caballeronia mineralivorans PML1(12) TaxID=908627 RepID=A0A0J1G5R7_9BURK|nr:hypothetical protein EOS_03810 [Caballeronia mineralivorans PML1(12)]
MFYELRLPSGKRTQASQTTLRALAEKPLNREEPPNHPGDSKPVALATILNFVVEFRGVSRCV